MTFFQLFHPERSNKILQINPHATHEGSRSSDQNGLRIYSDDAYKALIKHKLYSVNYFKK